MENKGIKKNIKNNLTKQEKGDILEI